MLLHINMNFISENPSKPCYPRAIKTKYHERTNP